MKILFANIVAIVLILFALSSNFWNILQICASDSAFYCIFWSFARDKLPNIVLLLYEWRNNDNMILQTTKIYDLFSVEIFRTNFSKKCPKTRVNSFEFNDWIYTTLETWRRTPLKSVKTTVFSTHLVCPSLGVIRIKPSHWRKQTNNYYQLNS